MTALEDEFLYFSAVVQQETMARHASLTNMSEPWPRQITFRDESLCPFNPWPPCQDSLSVGNLWCGPWAERTCLYQVDYQTSCDWWQLDNDLEVVSSQWSLRKCSHPITDLLSHLACGEGALVVRRDFLCPYSLSVHFHKAFNALYLNICEKKIEIVGIAFMSGVANLTCMCKKL